MCTATTPAPSSTELRTSSEGVRRPGLGGSASTVWSSARNSTHASPSTWLRSAWAVSGHAPVRSTAPLRGRARATARPGRHQLVEVEGELRVVAVEPSLDEPARLHRDRPQVRERLRDLVGERDPEPVPGREPARHEDLAERLARPPTLHHERAQRLGGDVGGRVQVRRERRPMRALHRPRDPPPEQEGVDPDTRSLADQQTGRAGARERPHVTDRRRFTLRSEPPRGRRPGRRIAGHAVEMIGQRGR